MVIYIVIAVIIAVAAIFLYRKKKGEKKVPAGLQIFDADGDLTFDLANNTTYVLGTGSTNAKNGSLNNSKITTRTWVIVLSCPADGVMPYFSVSSGVLSWQYLTGKMTPSPKNVTFMYGVY